MNFEISTKRHSLAHILAQAVKEIYPNAKLWTWPDTEYGFYYDIDFGDIQIEEKDLKEIEKKMKNIVKQNQKFNYFKLPMNEAVELIKERGEDYKIQIAEKLKNLWETELGFYENINQKWERTFVDMCKWPHVNQTLDIDVNSFCLDKIAWAYFGGDEKNKMLTRVYGLWFDTREELDAHKKFLVEAKKRDHRILGDQFKLFTLSKLVGSGLPLFQPNGMIIRKELEDYLWDLHKVKDYQRVCTPHLAKEALYECSGHAGHYLDDMFKVHGGTSKEDFFLKPMNCPHHMQIFADNRFSYKDMPVRYFEPAVVYRDEKSGELSGLTRVRAITQDDGHLFCRVSQIEEEVKVITEIIKEFYTVMGMTEDYWVSLSVRDSKDTSKYLGSDEVWNTAETALENAAKSSELPYKRVEWEAAFYGPKLDFMFKDCLGREWQLATIQCDFNQPERFNLSFKNEKGEDERPVVIHRAIGGSFERIMWILIEHFACVWPLWLAPNMVTVVPVMEKANDYAKDLVAHLRSLDIRAKTDLSDDGLNKKVRNAEKSRTNYILVVWEEEMENETVSVRNYKTKEQNTISFEQFVLDTLDEIKEKRL